MSPGHATWVSMTMNQVAPFTFQSRSKLIDMLGSKTPSTAPSKTEVWWKELALLRTRILFKNGWFETIRVEIQANAKGVAISSCPMLTSAEYVAPGEMLERSKHSWIARA